MSKQDFSTRHTNPTIKSLVSGNGEIDLQKYFGIFWRGKYLVGAIVIIFLIVGLFYARNLAPATFSATTVIAHGNTSGKVINGIPVNEHPTIVQMGLNTQLEVIKSRDLISQVVQELNLIEDPEFLAAVAGTSGSTADQNLSERKATSWLVSRVTTSNKRLSQIIRVTVKSGSSQLSAKLANGVAKTYVENQRKITLREYESTREVFQEQADNLLQNIKEMEQEIAALDRQNKANALNGDADPMVNTAVLTLKGSLERSEARYEKYLIQQSENATRINEDERQTRILSLATGGKANLSKNPLMIFLIFFGGLFTGLLVLIIREVSRRTFTSGSELEEATGVKAFGPISIKPDSVDGDEANQLDEKAALAIAKTKVLLLHGPSDKEPRSALISSAEPLGCVVELTKAVGRDLAKSGLSVLVVDAISKGGPDTASKQKPTSDLKLADHIEQDAHADLHLVRLANLNNPNRPSDGFQLAQKILEQSGGQHDFVLFALPATSISVDTSLIGQIVDQTLLVVDTAATEKATVHQAIRELSASNLQVDGLLFCGLK